MSNGIRLMKGECDRVFSLSLSLYKYDGFRCFLFFFFLFFLFVFFGFADLLMLFFSLKVPFDISLLIGSDSRKCRRLERGSFFC